MDAKLDEKVEKVARMIHEGTQRHGDVVRWEDDGGPTYFKDAHLTELGRESYRNLARAIIAALPPEDAQALRDRVRVLEEALRPFANITVEGEGNEAFKAKYPEMATKVATARAALTEPGKP